MNEEILLIIDSAKEAMQGSVSFLEKELTKIRAGKANPTMLERVRVMYYGASTPLTQVAAVTAPDPRMLAVKPFDKSALSDVERAIVEANLGLNPQNDGEMIRVPIPALSGERRKDLVKQSAGEGENAKISIRNARRDHIDQIKKLKDDGFPEDQIKRGEDTMNEVTTEFTKKIDAIIKKKEDEILTV